MDYEHRTDVMYVVSSCWVVPSTPNEVRRDINSVVSGNEPQKLQNFILGTGKKLIT